MELHVLCTHTIFYAFNEMFHPCLLKEHVTFIAIVIWEIPKWQTLKGEKNTHTHNTNKHERNFVVERNHQQIINSLQIYLDAAHKWISMWIKIRYGCHFSVVLIKLSLFIRKIHLTELRNFHALWWIYFIPSLLTFSLSFFLTLDYLRCSFTVHSKQNVNTNVMFPWQIFHGMV